MLQFEYGLASWHSRRTVHRSLDGFPGAFPDDGIRRPLSGGRSAADVAREARPFQRGQRQPDPGKRSAGSGRGRGLVYSDRKSVV